MEVFQKLIFCVIRLFNKVILKVQLLFHLHWLLILIDPSTWRTGRNFFNELMILVRLLLSSLRGQRLLLICELIDLGCSRYLIDHLILSLLIGCLLYLIELLNSLSNWIITTLVFSIKNLFMKRCLHIKRHTWIWIRRKLP